MFTGLVQTTGTLRAVQPRGTGRVLRVEAELGELEIGESIACNGICLTVEEAGRGAFQVAAGEETLRRTTLRNWAPGLRIHLERALRAMDRLGGHIVQGHVDGIARVRAVDARPGFVRMDVQPPESLLRYLVEKGSVTLDGVSLTVNGVDGGTFHVGLVPHTLAVTRLGALCPGDELNIEVDVLARHVERLLAPSLADKLRAHGFVED